MDDDTTEFGFPVVPSGQEPSGQEPTIEVDAQVTDFMETLLDTTTILPKYDGYIHIGYNADSGDFEVTTDVKVLSENSAETLALIMIMSAQGKLNEYISEALMLWAEDYEEENKFLKKLIEKYSQYEEIVGKTAETTKSNGLIKPSHVFNFKSTE